VKVNLEVNILKGEKLNKSTDDLNVFKYNFVDITSMRYWWICHSDVPFTEDEIKRFIQKLKTRLWRKSSG
jgi:hypothetical protein